MEQRTCFQLKWKFDRIDRKKGTLSVFVKVVYLYIVITNVILHSLCHTPNRKKINRTKSLDSVFISCVILFVILIQMRNRISKEKNIFNVYRLEELLILSSPLDNIHNRRRSVVCSKIKCVDELSRVCRMVFFAILRSTRSMFFILISSWFFLNRIYSSFNNRHAENYSWIHLI